MSTAISPLNITVGTYDGTIAGLSLVSDDPQDSTSALTLTTNFATSTHATAIRSVALHGSTLATGGSDETIHLYDVRSRVELGTLLHHDSTITSLTFADDFGRTLLFSSGGKGDAAICVWHKPSKKVDWSLLSRLEGHAAGITDVAIHPTTAVALSVAQDRALFMWNLKRGRVTFSVKTKRNVRSVAWSPSGLRYVLAGEGGIISVADITGRDMSTWVCEQASNISRAAFLDDDVVAGGGDDGVVRLWDARVGGDSEVAVAMKHDARITGLEVVDGLVMAVDASGGLKIWDVRMAGQPRIETDMATKARITCMAAAHQVWKPSSHFDDDDEREKQEDESEDDEDNKTKERQQEAEKLKQLEGTASQRKRKKRKVIQQQ